MSTTNGQPANQNTFNNAFVSRTDPTTSTNAELALTNTNPGSGASITNAQKEQNSIASYAGKAVNASATALPVWVDTSVGTPTDDLTERAEALTVEAGAQTAALAAHEADTSTHGVGVIVGTTETQTLSSKTFSDSVTIAEIATPSTPASGFGRVYFKADGRLYQLNDGGIETEVGSGAGAGVGINYAAMIDSSDAEQGLGDWTTYDDASATPVDGDGGTVALTITQSATTPLRGAYSYLITPNGAALGEGAVLPFEIDSADQAKVLGVSFDYELSGTIAEGDYSVWLYDVTNSMLIQPAPFELPSGVTGQRYSFNASFQTASNSTSYRLLIHQAVVTSETLKIDNVFIGPELRVQGVPVTDWQSFTPTGTWVTNTTYAGRWRRVGDSMEAQVYVLLTGAPTGDFTVNLPSGYAIDTAKLPVATDGRDSIGIANAGDVGVGSHVGITTYATSTSVSVFGDDGSGRFTATSPFTFGSTDFVSIEFKVPILGWSSSVEVSSSADTRVVIAQGTGDPASAGAGAPIIFPTVGYDTHGSYNTTTGRFTAPVPGFYKVYGQINSASAGNTLTIYVDAVSGIAAGTTDSNGECSFIGTVRANAGQLIDLRPGGTLDANSSSTIHFERISGPSQIAASETTSASYETSAGQSIPDTTVTIVNFGTPVDDSHGSVTTGAAWKFTAPSSGRYQISASVMFSATTTWADGESATLNIWKSGVVQRSIGRDDYGSISSIFKRLSGSTYLRLNAGEYLDLRLTQVSGAALTLHTDPLHCWVSIIKVGN